MDNLEDFKWRVLIDFEDNGLEGKTRNMLFTLQLTVERGNIGYDDICTPDLERLGFVKNNKATKNGVKFYEELLKTGYYKNGIK